MMELERDENPADGLTKSLRPLNLWTNLVDAVGLVPGPNEKGQNWIKNFLNQIQKEEEMKELAQLNVDPTCDLRRGVVSNSSVVYVSHVFRMSSFLFSFVSSFITSWKHLH